MVYLLLFMCIVRNMKAQFISLRTHCYMVSVAMVSVAMVSVGIYGF